MNDHAGTYLEQVLPGRSGEVRLRELEAMPARKWDDTIHQYAEATVYHLSPWHTCLERSLPGRVVRFEVEVSGEPAGHWCGFLLQRYGARIFGAPLPGSSTDYMYPLFSRRPLATDFLRSVGEWASGRRVHLVELGGEYFTEADLTAQGYETHPIQTFRVDLSGGADAVWKQMKPAMRNKIRKAEKNGVIITEDSLEEFPRRFFDMLRAVFGRQGLSPTYGLDRIQNVVDALSGSGNFVPLTAWHHGEAVAAVILLMDRHTAYYWGGASYESAYPVGANDIIHWHAFQMAIEKGLTVYDTCGGGEYKTKFGGRLVHVPTGHLSLSPGFAIMRAAARRAVRARSLLLGQARRLKPLSGR